jgi:hypothetical protein
MARHDLLGDSQPDAGAAVLLPAVESLEDDEDPLEVVRLDPDAVVLDADAPAVQARVGGRDVDARGLGTPELDRVPHQVQEQVLELPRVTAHGRERVVAHDRAGFVEGELQVRQGAVERGAHVGRDEGRTPGADPRVDQQVLDQLLHAMRPIHGVADEFVGVRVQLALVALSQQLDEARHHAERLLQVVRGLVREPL